jgi:Domain of unknown function (DUF4159)
MRRREFIAGLGSVAAWPLVARAQQGERVRRIGLLSFAADDSSLQRSATRAFREELRKLGWIEGRNRPHQDVLPAARFSRPFHFGPALGRGAGECHHDDEQETKRPARGGDGVSSIIITSNDLAGAWATRPDGAPTLPLVPGEPRQREFAFRAGVNIVMYTLTGNYKADQVHVPALLERLGQ